MGILLKIEAVVISFLGWIVLLDVAVARMIGAGSEEDKSFFGENMRSGDSESYAGPVAAVSGKLQFGAALQREITCGSHDKLLVFE